MSLPWRFKRGGIVMEKNTPEFTEGDRSRVKRKRAPPPRAGVAVADLPVRWGCQRGRHIARNSTDVTAPSMRSKTASRHQKHPPPIQQFVSFHKDLMLSRF